MKDRTLWMPLVDHRELAFPADWGSVFGRPGRLSVEIGFGAGEFLLRSTNQAPEVNFLGIEQHWERIYKTLKKIASARRTAADEDAPASNIRILRLDARTAFEWFFDKHSIDHIDALFPCPWPKKDHIKHRLFSSRFLKLLNSRLKPGGRIRIVTDFEPYGEWVLEEAKAAGFEADVRAIGAQFDTKFERKWQGEGQEEFLEIILAKDGEAAAFRPAEGDVKGYLIKAFDPQRFVFSDCKGGIAVIFKEMLFDAQRQKAVVRLVVAEGHLTQPFRVMIFKKEDGWRVCKEEGQHFFPTPGITRALELVYQAAQRSGGL